MNNFILITFVILSYGCLASESASDNMKLYDQIEGVMKKMEAELEKRMDDQNAWIEASASDQANLDMLLDVFAERSEELSNIQKDLRDCEHDLMIKNAGGLVY